MKTKSILGFVGIVAALAFATSAMAATFSTNLTVGSTGADVKALQVVLNASADTQVSASGVGSAGNESSYFGALTKAAVIKFQLKNGISPAVGYVGSITRAVLNGTTAVVVVAPTTPAASALCPNGMTLASNCATAPATAVVAVALCPNGMTLASNCTSAVVAAVVSGAGDMSVVEISTDVKNHLVEGRADVKGLGFKIEAKDSDIKVTNMKIVMTHSEAGPTYLDRYASDVSVWMNGAKVATVLASEFNKDSTGVYSKSIALANAIVKKGISNKATFYITTSGISNIDSADMDAWWTVKVQDFRFVDGTGVMMTYQPDPTIENLLTVKDITTVGDVTLVISKGSASPLAQNIQVSNTSSTPDVLLLEIKVKSTGAAMTFDALNISLSTDAEFMSNILGDLRLMDGTTQLASFSSASTTADSEVVTFNLDSTYTISAGATKTFKVVARINDVDNFEEGESLTASYLSTTRFEVESTRTEIEEDGSAIGEPQTFFSKGAIVKFVSDSYVPGVDGANGTISLTFTVTVFGENDIVISSTDTEGPTAVMATVTGPTPVDSIVTSSSLVVDINGDFTVAAGDTKTFTLSKKIEVPTGFVSLKIDSVAGTTVSNVKTRTY